MNQNTFNQLLDMGKFILGLALLGYGFYNGINQFLMILGGFLIAVSGIEVNFGNIAKIKGSSKKK